jgi:hypothetical protein
MKIEITHIQPSTGSMIYKMNGWHYVAPAPIDIMRRAQAENECIIVAVGYDMKVIADVLDQNREL